MRSLLNFLLRYQNIIILLLLEAAAFYLLANSTSYHNAKITNSLRGCETAMQEKVANFVEYFKLREINNTLSEENTRLRNTLERTYSNSEISFFAVNDSVQRQQYVYTQAYVVNQSLTKQKNFFTLNKGTSHGIDEGMAVVGPDGIAGVIVGVDKNFSVAMSLLNLDFRLSARFRKNGYFGSLNWKGLDRSLLSFDEIPHHLIVNIGDTIETSGFSALFPAGLMVGCVSGFDDKDGDFYNIDVKLATDFHNLNYIYIIGNLKRYEQVTLEESIEEIK